jgi:hypothetical protein
MRYLGYFLWLVAAIALLIFSLLNIQPWLSVAGSITEKITEIPFYATVTEVPIIGGLISWFLENSVLRDVVAVLLWGLVGAKQIAPIILHDRWVLHNVMSRTAPANRINVYRLLQSLQEGRAFAYLAEIIVFVLYSPPYEGGIESLAMDFPYLDWDLIDWENVLFVVVAVVAVEGLVMLILRTRRALSILGGHTGSSTRTQPRPQPVTKSRPKPRPQPRQQPRQQQRSR